MGADAVHEARPLRGARKVQAPLEDAAAVAVRGDVQAVVGGGVVDEL